MNKKINPILAIGMVVLCGLLAGTSIALVGLRLKNNTCSYKPPAPQDETAGWQTYRNEEYGFEIMYPNYLKLSEEKNCEEGPVVLFESSDFKIGYGDNNYDYLLPSPCYRIYSGPRLYSGFQISILRYRFSQVWPYPDNLDDYIRSANMEIIKRFIINGYSAIRAIPYNSPYDIASVFIDDKINKNLVKFNLKYDLKTQDITSRDEILKLFDQILSTFRFID